MKKAFLLLLAMLRAVPARAGAETYFIKDATELPADWAEREILRITFVDTNRSDAMILQCGGEAMMVDGGFNSHYKRVFATLDGYGVTQLKYLYSTHCDGDHSQGLTTIMNSDLYAPGLLLSPNKETYNDPDDHHEKMVRASRRHNVPYQVIDDGDVFTLGSATITVMRVDQMWGQNARSAACRVDFNGGRILLLADVSTRVLNYWMETRDPAEFDCDLMKANHHGIDGVPETFMAAATPSVIVCTNNTNYDHDIELERLGALYSGDGTVHIETDGVDWYVWQDPNWID
jgi:beta-lactamase superfamily II metal-dependent hydrolase